GEWRESSGDRAPLDWAGAGFVTLGLGGVVWALTAFPQRGVLDPAVMASFVMGTVALMIFLMIEARQKDRAMMPLALFGTASFSGISLLTLFLYAALGGLIVVLPYMLISAFGFSATAAGAAILPFPLIIGTLSRNAGSLAVRIGISRILTIGPVMVAAGFLLLARMPVEGFSYWLHVLPGLVVMSLGMALSVAPLTTAVMNAVSDDRVGIASGVNNAISRIAGLVATALIGLVLVRAETAGDALVSGFRGAALVGAGLAVLSAISAVLLIGRDVEETREG
ncbi:MAG: MFS transporter, partial [Pseudomonadota bacterium]